MKTSRKYVLTQDYYGNKSYGKRVFWIAIDGEQTNQYVWLEDHEAYVKQLEEDGHEVELVWAYKEKRK